MSDDPCPQCGSKVVPAIWRDRGAWSGQRTPERRRQFRPAECVNSACDWEGQSDDAAVAEARARARDGG
jgi:hypothetical protein